MKDKKGNSRRGMPGRRILSVFFSLVLVLGLIPAMTFATAKDAQATEGSGTAGDPYIISTAEELRALSGTALSGHYKLGADIDLSGENFAPITSLASGGSFDGAGHTISKMTINNSGDYVGFIRQSRGTIQNLVFTDVSVTAGYGNYHGTVVGYNYSPGLVKNVKVNGAVSYTSNGSGVCGKGGVVGYNTGDVDGCSFGGSVNYTGSTNNRIGGIVGYHAQGHVRNCFNTGTVTSGKNEIGGIVGVCHQYNTSSPAYVENCYNLAAISGHSSVGGIAGEATSGGYLKNCYNAGKTTAEYGQTYAGSIVRNNTNGHVEACYGIQGGPDNSTSPLIGYSNHGGASAVQNNEEALQEMCNKLNEWIDQQTDPTLYKRWYYGDGRPYPTFDPMMVKVTFKAGDSGNFGKDDEEKPITEVVEEVEVGAAWDATWVATATPDAGYEFTGWDPAEFPDKVTEDLTYTAQWKAKTDTPYTVEYYYQTKGAYSDTPTSTDNRTGTTDTTAYVTDDDKMPTQDGYVLDNGAGNVFSGTIAGDGSLKLKVYFKQQFTVVYDPGTQGTWTAADETTEGLAHNSATPSFGKSGATTANSHNAGYHFTGWDPATIAEKVIANATYTAQWAPDEDTAYKVEFYYQSAGQYGSPASSANRTGTTGSPVSVTDADKTPDPTQTGYVLDESKSDAWSGNIAGDGSLILKTVRPLSTAFFFTFRSIP